MAWANVQRDEYKLAEMAVDQLILENLRFPQFQQIYFLRIIVAVGEGEKQKKPKMEHSMIEQFFIYSLDSINQSISLE